MAKNSKKHTRIVSGKSSAAPSGKHSPSKDRKKQKHLIQRDHKLVCKRDIRADNIEKKVLAFSDTSNLPEM